jgi:hypothetical protein
MSCGWSNSDELRLVDSAFDPTNRPDGIECSGKQALVVAWSDAVAYFVAQAWPTLCRTNSCK